MSEADRNMKPAFLDGLLQFRHPPEFRIALPPEIPPPPAPGSDGQAPSAPPAEDATVHSPPPAPPALDALHEALVGELATCLWYLKTKHFKREWRLAEASDEDHRVRRALRRIERATDALRAAGVEVVDPVRQRYPIGGEALMRPVQLIPTPGVTFEVVAETLSPLVLRDQRPILRAEVLVAVPLATEPAADAPAAADPGSAPADSVPPADRAAGAPPPPDLPPEA